VLPVVDVGDGHVALASITEPSGHLCVDVCGVGGGVGHVALASITEPLGHVCVDGCGGGVVVVVPLPLLSVDPEPLLSVDPEPEEPLLSVEPLLPDPLLSVDPEELPLLSVCAKANVGSAPNNTAIIGTSKITPIPCAIITFLYLFIIILYSMI
jgi:hypothetical protein